MEESNELFVWVKVDDKTKTGVSYIIKYKDVIQFVSYAYDGDKFDCDYDEDVSITEVEKVKILVPYTPKLKPVEKVSDANLQEKIMEVLQDYLGQKVLWSKLDELAKDLTNTVLNNKGSEAVEGWISANTPPIESGRYWCYVSEIGDLGLSHYQWNCAYNKEDNRWSSNAQSKCVTHWQPLPSAPKQ
jgi:hypothetical protein